MLTAAIVTGATGYLGSQLVKQLVQSNVRVGVIVRAHSDLSLLNELASSITIFQDQGTHEPLVSFIKKINPEVIFHLASLFLVEHKPDQIPALIEANILFSTRLCEAMREAGVKRLVNTGTSWQHYQNDAYKPVNLYAATKQAFYEIARYYVDAQAFQVINLELFDTYGPNDPRKKLIQILLKHIDQLETLSMSPGEQELNLVHVDDVCAAFLQAAHELLAMQIPYFESYVVRGAETITLRQLVFLLQKIIAPRKLLIEFGGRPYRNREVMQLWQQGKCLANWRARIPLQDGLRQLL